MRKAEKIRKLRRMGGWPFIAAMMNDADFGPGFRASAKFGGPGWGFDFGPRGVGLFSNDRGVDRDLPPTVNLVSEVENFGFYDFTAAFLCREIGFGQEHHSNR